MLTSNAQLSASFKTWNNAVKNLLDAAQTAVDIGDIGGACDILTTLTARQSRMITAMRNAAENINGMVQSDSATVVVIDADPHG